MLWFDLLFGPLMILGFPVLAWFIPARFESEQARGDYRRRWRRAHGCTLLLLGTFFAARVFFPPAVSRQFWMLCFIQMPLFIRLIPAKNPSWGSPFPSGSQRAASLQVRTRSSPVPARAWAIAWIVWLVPAMFAAWALVEKSGTPGSSQAAFIVSLLLPIGALCLAFGPYFVRLVLREPEPMDPADSADLREAYRRHRYARAWMFYIFPLVIAITQAAFAAVIAWLPPTAATQRALGMIGGVAGTVGGLLGAAAGIYFGVWRAKLNQTVRDLTGKQSSTAGERPQA